MTENRTNIPAQPLAEYVAKHEVAWQMCEGLVEFHDLLKAMPGDMCLKIKSMIKKFDK